MQILLTRGFATLVDDDIDPYLLSLRWYAAGLEGRPARRYREDGSRRLIFMYHQILKVLPWELSVQGLVVDHIDRNPLNNLKSNLRIVTQTVNMRNTERSLYKKGICYDNTHDRYKAYIDQYDKPRINVGTFRTEEEAAVALAAAKEALIDANH